MANVEQLPYRPCVGIVLLNGSGKVWVGRRTPKWSGDGSAQMWQMPQGGIDRGETPRDAAQRELEEEVGTTKATILSQTDDWLFYDLPHNLVGTALKGRYRGQKQKWFAMRFEGEDHDINISGTPQAKPEFDQWKWVEMAELPNLVVPFKRDVYEQVVSAFSALT